MDAVLGYVSSVAGAQMNVHAEGSDTSAVRLGSLVKVRNGTSYAVGAVGAMHLDGASPPHPVYIVDLLGEIAHDSSGAAVFRRGVTHSPHLGAQVALASREDHITVYAPMSTASIRVGVLTHDETQPAYVMLDELLQKHFAVVGTTGAGKSCAVTLLLSGILESAPNAHIVLLDPHNEYAAAFGDVADLVNVDSLHLPFWLFDLEEAVRVVVRGGTEQEQEAQAIILKDAIAQARRHYAGNGGDTAWITVDTPVPFRLHDLLRFINEAMGRLDKPDTARPYLRLRARLESLRDDRRYSFMFNDSFANRDTLSQVVGHLLRIPVNGKPLTILDLSGVPSEIADVVVSLSCRLIFDFTLWSDTERRPPILLVCEEAHRYAPDDERVGFAAAARALTRIAKEGRKYGLSLALVSQRPSELSVHALSQCGTIFALRMGNEGDQRIVSRALPDAGHAMIRALPSLPTQHAVVYGEGVALPMRIRFDDLPQNRRPYSRSAEFSKAWQHDSADDAFREEGIQRWRMQNRAARSHDGETRVPSSP